MAAAVAYDAAMANWLAELRGDHDSIDVLAETVFGADAMDPGAAAVRATRQQRVLPPVKQAAVRSRLFRHAVAIGGLSVGSIVLAVLLWQPPSVVVIAEESARSISPHLVAASLSRDEGTPHFLGTVGDSWNALPLPKRRRVVARIAARLEGDGVHSLTLMDTRSAIQARHDGDTLLWVAPASVAPRPTSP